MGYYFLFDKRNKILCAIARTLLFGEGLRPSPIVDEKVNKPKGEFNDEQQRQTRRSIIQVDNAKPQL
jgi:hypothetical protein